MDILGYFQIYMYIEFDDDTATINSVDMDFRTPITEETFKLVADMFKTHYETNGKHVVNIKCVSKEAYIVYKEKYPNEGTVVKFDENKISIEGN